MKSSRRYHLLTAAGLLTAAMGAFHFLIPTIFGWSVEVEMVHPTVRWALFALNFFFSALILLIGIVTIIGVSRRHAGEWSFTAIAWAGAIFWLVNGCYQVWDPMPMPRRLFLLSVFLKAYAFGVSALYAFPLLKSRRQ